MIFPPHCNCIQYWWKLGKQGKNVRLNLPFHQLSPQAAREIWRHELREALAQPCAASTEIKRWLEFQLVILSGGGHSQDASLAKREFIARPIMSPQTKLKLMKV